MSCSMRNCFTGTQSTTNSPFCCCCGSIEDSEDHLVRNQASGNNSRSAIAEGSSSESTSCSNCGLEASSCLRFCCCCSSEETARETGITESKDSRASRTLSTENSRRRAIWIRIRSKFCAAWCRCCCCAQSSDGEWIRIRHSFCSALVRCFCLAEVSERGWFRFKSKFCAVFCRCCCLAESSEGYWIKSSTCSAVCRCCCCIAEISEKAPNIQSEAPRVTNLPTVDKPQVTVATLPTSVAQRRENRVVKPTTQTVRITSPASKETTLVVRNSLPRGNPSGRLDTLLRMQAAIKSPTVNGAGSYSSSSRPLSPVAHTKSVSRMGSLNISSHRQSNSQRISVVHDTALTLRRKSAAELGAGVSQGADDASFIRLVEWIRTERLSSLPHKGSRWDTVLIRAIYFAERLHAFESVLRRYGAESDVATQLAYGHVQLLLELGHENSSALDKAFGFFYRCSLGVASLLSRSEVLTFSSDTQEQICLLYTDLLTLVVEVAIRFYKTVHGKVATSANLDMYEAFGSIINVFHSRRDSIIEAIWKDQITNEGYSVGAGLDIKTLSRWLAPQDRVLASLGPDHTVFTDDMAEFTCVWFQDTLTKFVKSEEVCLLVNGASGSGKTTLAASIAERLQRPVARKSYSTLFCSIGAAPSQATSLNIVKTLLNQLLDIRVGNMHLWRAVSEAYDTCRYTADADAYERILWNALGDALKHPLAGVKDTIMIVDGLDELIEGQSSGQSVLNQLVNVTTHSKGVKFVGLSTSLSLPESTRGMKYTITADNIRSDIHAVAIRSLSRTHNFTHKPAPEQESIVERLIDAANGSFLWAVLACEIIRSEKSQEAFNKTLTELPTSKSSVEDLVARLITLLKPDEEAKTVLSWLVHTARPLTFEELECLFSIDTTNGTQSDRRVDVNHIIESVAPLLSIRENVIRIRHNKVLGAVRTLLDNGKVTTTVKDRPLDLLLRILTYAKVSLHEKGEPTLDNTDQTLVDRLFRRYHFVEYVIRYWTWHLRQTSIVPTKGSDYKVSQELVKAFPESTNMPILEWLCWDDQFPGSQEVELHELVAKLRSKVFSENHPTVLQSYINTAFYYETLDDLSMTTKYFYYACTIGRNVLGVSHPIVVECSTRVLRYSDTLVTTTRSEIMTYREQVLIILISAYERQFGVSAEIVTETRRLLAELYVHIHEETKAAEILGIDGTTEEKHAHDSQEARDLSRHIQVTIKKGKDGQELDTYGNLIFGGEDADQETTRALDLTQVDVLLRRAESYFSQKNYVKAEETYVELWQRLSETCRTTLSTEWHAKKIDTVQAYSKFLTSQKREVETATVLTCLWEEYQHHELSYSETVVSRLTQSAKTLKSMGYYSAALAIFQHTSSYYKNVRREDSRSLTEINEEIATTSTQVLQQTMNFQSSTALSESTNESIFRSLITDTSKSIDSTTISLAKQMSSRYIEERRYSEAVTVIQSTLQRTWSSFLATSVQEVSLTSTFTQESIELVEQLAECYTRMRLFEKVEDVYVRLFRATLSASTKQTTLLEKARTLLINFYSSRGYSSKTISVYQELLAYYRRTLGPSHETTIKALYELAALCRAHARSHPYWVEYYQQIVTILNKDSTTCHTGAIEAAVIVAESYWEERRYTDAVSLYTVLWNTFVSNQKAYKSFTETTFVKNLYERYYQCLEETNTDFATLHKVTSQYRETCVAAFGASSTIAVEATLSLARVSQMSSSHTEEAIKWYEEVSKSSSTSSSSFEHSEMRQILTTLYKRRVTSSSSSSSASSEEVSRAASVYQEQYAESRSKYGYSHEMTLSNLREASMLYCRQSKSELAVKELTTAVSEIVSKETSSQRLLESATSIAQTFHACNQVQQCRSLVEELQYQLITKETRKSSTFSFDLTKSSSASLFFLAVLEYNVRVDHSVTLSEIMAEITAATVYYNEFKRVTKARSALDKILIAGAPLYELLNRTGRKQLASAVEAEIVQIFVQRDTANLQLLSKDSPRIFIVSILEYLGRRPNSDFVRAVILASNRTLSRLIAENKFKEAYDVANISFIYAKYRKGYHGPRAISRGFELASYLDGRGENRCPDEDLRKKLLKLSNSIIKEILTICREQKINFAQVQLSELNQLIALLGEQQDYETLESLLTDLWNTRDAQRSWPSDVLLNLGRRLVCARYLAGQQVKSVRLCEDIAYNLRRVNGARHPATLETYSLLAQLYTGTAQYYQKQASSDKAAAALAADYFKKAIVVQEDILRWLVHDKVANADDDDEDDDEDTAATILKEHGISVNGNKGEASDADEVKDQGAFARTHLRLLKLAYQRLGSWAKPFSVYERLNADLFKAFADSLKGVEGVEKWQAKGYGSGKAESNDGLFTGVSDWEILGDELRNHLERNRTM